MAGGSRTLKLSILGDVSNLNQSLKTAGGDVDSFGDKIGKTGKAIGLAFAAAAAAAGTAAIAIGTEAVKAAIADEKAQTQLALALKNSTGATDEQIASTEKAILKMSLASGVADDDLRPSLARLARATGDSEQAQKLLAQAMDISAATGKPLETVSNALGKAYEGSTTSLGKLGLGIDAAELKTMSFTEVQTKLSDLFGGAAAANADTMAGKIAQMQVGFDEAKESLGVALLPIVEKFTQYLIDKVIPNIQSFINGLTGQGSLDEATQNATAGAFAFGERVKKVMATIIDLKDEIIATTVVIGTIFAVSKISAGISATIAAVKGLIAVYNTLKASALVAGIASAFALNPLLGVAAVAVGAGVLIAADKLLAGDNTGNIPVYSSGGAKSMGGATAANIQNAGGGGDGGGTTIAGNASKLAADLAPTVFSSLGNFSENSGMGLAALVPEARNRSTGDQYNITVNGALDSESTARQIVQVLNDSYYRGTGGANALSGTSIRGN